MSAVQHDQPPYTLGVCFTVFWWLLLAWALSLAFALGAAIGSFLVWTFDSQLRALFWAWASVNF